MNEYELFYPNIIRVIEVADEERCNRYLMKKWKLLNVFTTCINENNCDCITIYVLGWDKRNGNEPSIPVQM